MLNTKAKVKSILKPLFYRLPVRERSKILETYFKIRTLVNTKKSEPKKGDITSISGDLSLLSSFNRASTEPDILVFPVIDWDFRVQRPQHLSRELGLSGCRVIYFTTTFNVSSTAGFKIIKSPEKNVIICSLNISQEGLNIYKDDIDEEQIEFLVRSVNLVRLSFGLGFTHSLVNLPFWRKIVESLSSNHIIYDCMDHHAGFENNESEMLDEENKLLESSDLVITTAQRLSDLIAEKKENVIIRNGAEINYFATDPQVSLLEKKRPIVGYYGAIAEWFDVDLLVKSAENYPQWDFVIIGNVTCDVSKAKKLKNINFLGEVPYDKLTGYLREFDVCLIPFKLIELTLCTNPVKVYEYLAAGKPVVCTAMPEVKIIDDIVHVADSEKCFVDMIALAMEESQDTELAEKRKVWALSHDWAARTSSLREEIFKLNKVKPKVSIIVLTYNNLHLTKDCLASIELNTKYDNYEVIVVDNMSTDGTRDYLVDVYTDKEKYKIILNEDNLGFAAGNNIGLKVADGDILVILNNDTYVGPFWLGGLVKALRNNPELGLVGPVTNNIGNESKINIKYSNWSEMNIKALDHYSKNIGQIYPMDCAAFFCVAMHRKVYEIVGEMSLDYGLGFFEDDDYCMRIRKNNWKIAAVEESFVHHHLSASFNKLKGNKKELLMQKNKGVYESKWGEWKPHSYRPGVY